MSPILFLAENNKVCWTPAIGRTQVDNHICVRQKKGWKTSFTNKMYIEKKSFGMK